MPLTLSFLALSYASPKRYFGSCGRCLERLFNQRLGLQGALNRVDTVPFNAVHTPIEASKKYLARFLDVKNPQQKTWGWHS